MVGLPVTITYPSEGMVCCPAPMFTMTPLSTTTEVTLFGGVFVP